MKNDIVNVAKKVLRKIEKQNSNYTTDDVVEYLIDKFGDNDKDVVELYNLYCKEYDRSDLFSIPNLRNAVENILEQVAESE